MQKIKKREILLFYPGTTLKYEGCQEKRAVFIEISVRITKY